jgi:hypothetical protein
MEAVKEILGLGSPVANGVSIYRFIALMRLEAVLHYSFRRYKPKRGSGEAVHLTRYPLESIRGECWDARGSALSAALGCVQSCSDAA